MVASWIQRIICKIIFTLNHFVAYILSLGKQEHIPPVRDSLLLKSATQLAAEIREGRLKSAAVVQAYINRIKEVNPYINAIVEDRFEKALKKAVQVDELIRSGKLTTEQLRDEKPLLGVPFTVKLLLKMKGFRNTAGSKIYEDAVSSEDCSAVTLMKNAGGIALATTNIPEFGFAIETNNLLHGKTSNPYDLCRTPGGSSGGEAAILAAAGSVIGLGNDYGGSLRIPAHFTGIFAHKASRGLVPNTGNYMDFSPQISKNIYFGPMCRYSEDLSLLIKILSAESGIKLNFNHQVNFKKLKIYYILDHDDPMVHLLDKEIAEAIHRAIRHFTSTYGTTAKEIKMPLLKHSNAIVTHASFYYTKNLTETCTSGKIVNYSLISDILKYFIGKSTFHLFSHAFLNIAKMKMFYSEEKCPFYVDICNQIDKYFDELLDENSVLIYPTFPVTAPYHYEGLSLLSSIPYTSIFNIIGLPATNCPIGFNKQELPIGMQIIGRLNNDSLTLVCADELSNKFGGWRPTSILLNNK